MKDELNMRVSSACSKEGRKYAFVSFDDGTREAEGRIPDCRIVSNHGFNEDEVLQLEQYMKKELEQLKKIAAGVRVIDAFMKPDN